MLFNDFVKMAEEENADNKKLDIEGAVPVSQEDPNSASPGNVEKGRHGMEHGKEDNSGNDHDLVMNLLYKALADELLAWYQYWVCRNLSRGPGKFDVDPEFDEHMKEEWDHVGWVMDRIKELGGVPYTNPDQWLPNANPWPEVTETSVPAQLDKTIEAENTAIKFYKEACEAVRHVDLTTYTLFKKILGEEEKHAYDLHMLKEAVQ